jgi:hypothetical protein
LTCAVRPYYDRLRVQGRRRSAERTEAHSFHRSTLTFFPVDAESLHRVTVRIIIGAPLDGALLRASAGGDRQLMMDAVGAAIAALLPAGYRGAYSNGSGDLTEARRVLDRVRRESTGTISAGSQ